MTEIEELTKVVEQANDGQWFPFAIIGGLLSVIMGLIILYWSTVQKSNEKRHAEAEDTLKEVVNNTTELKILSQKYDTQLDSHQGQINEIRRTANKAS